MRIKERSSSNRYCASARASSVLPTPGGSQENEAADGPLGIFQPAARAHDRVGHGFDGFVLADHALVKFLGQVQKLLDLAFEQLRERNPGPAADHLGDIFLVDFLFEQGRGVLF